MTKQRARTSFSRPTATAFGANGERKVSITGADYLEKMTAPPTRGQSRTPYQSKIYAESNSTTARVISSPEERRTYPGFKDRLIWKEQIAEFNATWRKKDA